METINNLTKLWQQYAHYWQLSCHQNLFWHYTLAWFPFTCPGQDDPDNHIEIRIKKETYLLQMKNSKFQFGKTVIEPKIQM